MRSRKARAIRNRQIGRPDAHGKFCPVTVLADRRGKAAHTPPHPCPCTVPFHMLMSPLSIDPSSPGAPGEPAAGAAIGVPDGGERFADQLANAQSLLPAGQNLAAGALPLQTVALGPTLEVVTAPHGGPDRDSLAAFAKAQGLDDDVVAWLFSDATQAQVQAQALLPIQIPTGVMALPASPNTGLVLGAAGGPGRLLGLQPTGRRHRRSEACSRSAFGIHG